jgi:hypothetical protein
LKKSENFELERIFKDTEVAFKFVVRWSEIEMSKLDYLKRYMSSADADEGNKMPKKKKKKSHKKANHTGFVKIRFFKNQSYLILVKK